MYPSLIRARRIAVKVDPAYFAEGRRAVLQPPPHYARTSSSLLRDGPAQSDLDQTLLKSANFSSTASIKVCVNLVLTGPISGGSNQAWVAFDEFGAMSHAVRFSLCSPFWAGRTMMISIRFSTTTAHTGSSERQASYSRVLSEEPGTQRGSASRGQGDARSDLCTTNSGAAVSTPRVTTATPMCAAHPGLRSRTTK